MAQTESFGSSLRSLVHVRREQIRALVARHHGTRVRLFGSVARGEEHADSDIDFLVDFGEGSSLFDLMHLSDALEDLLGHRVDIVSAGGLKSRDERIVAEAKDL